MTKNKHDKPELFDGDEIEGEETEVSALSFYMGENTPRRREHIMNHLVVDLEMI